MPSLKELGLSDKEFDKLINDEIVRKKKSITDDVKYAKESLASAVLRLMEAQKKSKSTGCCEK
jgi:hypothetical protein